MSNMAGVLESHHKNEYKISWTIDDFKFLHNTTSAYRNSPQILESAHFKMWDFNWKFKLILEEDKRVSSVGATIYLESMDARNRDKKGLSITAKLDAFYKYGGKSKYTNCSEIKLKDYKINFGTVFSFSSITQQIRQEFDFNWKFWLSSDPSAELKREVLNAKRIKLMVNKLGVMLDDKASHDVKIRCQGFEMTAHKGILSKTSSVFKAMFQAHMKETRESVVEVTVGTPEAVKTMLRWIYTGEIGEKETHDLDLFKLAHYYDLSELMEECQFILVDTICKESAIEILNEADLMGAKELKDSAIQFIIQNKSDFLEELNTKLRQSLVVEILMAT